MFGSLLGPYVEYGEWDDFINLRKNYTNLPDLSVAIVASLKVFGQSFCKNFLMTSIVFLAGFALISKYFPPNFVYKQDFADMNHF